MPRVDLRTTRTIRSAIEIRAPAETVWRILTDFSAYPDWNPHIRKVQGMPKVGARITIHSRPPGGRAFVLRPVVIKWSPPTELRWRGTVVSRRLFSGEHGFRVEELSSGRVRFHQDETFKGLFVPIYARMRLEHTREGFSEVNEALRQRAENAEGESAEASA